MGGYKDGSEDILDERNGLGIQAIIKNRKNKRNHITAIEQKRIKGFRSPSSSRGTKIISSFIYLCHLLMTTDSESAFFESFFYP